MAQLTLPSGQVVTYNYRVPKEKKPLSNKNFAWEMTLPCGCRCSGATKSDALIEEAAQSAETNHPSH